MTDNDSVVISSRQTLERITNFDASIDLYHLWINKKYLFPPFTRSKAFFNLICGLGKRAQLYHSCDSF